MLPLIKGEVRGGGDWHCVSVVPVEAFGILTGVLGHTSFQVMDPPSGREGMTVAVHVYGGQSTCPII